ncbi:chemotaxis-specific protein-glutamate methyltransferase CheB [Maridesulfovibrio frigidus]|uniref:chemotaxis-specific protein-glutamate methyltransferase CheB n=1 Tax=Maridesulfovibrio frigidus TaxID=340956 RepID=UPI0004E14217|nr:chemotaxis-specific protein-glutamate methyltransferase CheB [Maridesulfovibrio frigidus]
MIKVLIVDDSASVRLLLTEFFSREPDFEVVGCAEDGKSALRMVRQLNPDVVTMDVNLPDYDGFTVTRRIMEQNPVPIVIISAVYTASDAEVGFRLLDTGALAFHNKPAINDEFFNESMAEIVMSVRAMSEVKLVRRKATPGGYVAPSHNSNKKPYGSCPVKGPVNAKIVCIGASTGGPQALKQVLMSLPHDLPVPVMIVQHISTGFLEGLANWLHTNTGHNIQIAKDDETLKACTVYFAPEDYHIQISSKLKVTLTNLPAVNGIRPTVEGMFESVARNIGGGAVGVLLTGMGSDGAAALLEIRRRCGYTIAQDKETSIIFGMPGEAVKIGAAIAVLPLGEIADAIVKHTTGR